MTTWMECAKKPTGYFQIDLVQHDGGNSSGEFRCTLTMTDVKTGWTIHFALMNKAAVWVVKALDMALKRLPMGIKGIHSDSGSEFLNRPVDKWCKRNHVEFTRGRPTHKKTIAMSNKKTTQRVRKIVGCFRYTGEAGVATLQTVYDAYAPLLNLYYPCMKQVSCERAGAKKKRKYDAAKTPFLRLLDCSFEDKLVETNVKHSSMALKNSCALVEQKEILDNAIDDLLKFAQDVPAIPHRGDSSHG